MEKFINNPTNEILLYKGVNGDIQIEVSLINETIWLTQEQISVLFGVQRAAITKHLNNIFESGELNENSVCSILERTALDNKIYKVKHYNLDAVISVGYRVNSRQATQFRIWATSILKEYLIKGFAMNDERLKDPHYIFGKDYFEEQLERIRDIRSSERRFYQKITDIYSQCSSDYDSDSQITKNFFATVQNKLHWAISNQTAAEIIYNRADHTKNHMGLTNWKNAPLGKIRKNDVSIAKNYLSKEELEKLNRIVTMYLDYAENQAKKHILMTMNDWINRLNAFLQFNEEDILENNGKVSAEIAKTFAENEFVQYQTLQDQNYRSDFDKLIESTLKIEQKQNDNS